MSDFNLYSVNWQDGMLITQSHLKDQEKYFEELARWYALGTGDNYGLIKKSFSGKPALTLNNSVSGNRLRVEIVRCQAITPDGSYIEINESAGDVIRAEADISETTIPVYIGVDNSSKKLVGDPDPAEDVPRVPFRVSNYTAHLGQPPNLPEGQFIQVAKLSISGNEVGYADDYYPPCVSLNAEGAASATTGAPCFFCLYPDVPLYSGPCDGDGCETSISTPGFNASYAAAPTNL